MMEYINKQTTLKADRKALGVFSFTFSFASVSHSLRFRLHVQLLREARVRKKRVTRFSFSVTCSFPLSFILSMPSLIPFLKPFQYLNHSPFTPR
ncbi:hypothetical protein RIF29_21160 [Crotalaria pallida]|uniref:Transmembrane protein n=1 Tax=Crotalaria pallida TaxID=3830 RepID=A0AAN9F410_CROPI